MKKTLISLSFATLLTACGSPNYHQDIASINAERNSAQAKVTSASLEQARMQRQNQLEESILYRQRDAMQNQTNMEKSSVIGSFYDNTIGRIIK